MTLTLRAKLFLLVSLSILAAAAPIIMLTYDELKEISLKRENESFGNVIKLIQDNISARYLGLLSSESAGVAQRRQELQHFANLARVSWQNVQDRPEPDRRALMAAWTEPLRTAGLHFDLAQTPSTPMVGTPLIATLLANPDLPDLKGRTLASMLVAEQIPPTGMFAVFSVDESIATDAVPVHKRDAKPETVLIYVLPAERAPSAPVIIIATLLSDLIAESNATKAKIIASTQEKFDSLQLYANGFLVLMNGGGEILAHEGNPLGKDAAYIPQQGLELARKQGFVEFSQDAQHAAEGASTVFRMAYFKPLDWYVVAAVPRAEIEAGTRATVQRMVGLALTMGAFCLLATLIITARLINPLRTLTEQARSLASVDLTKATRTLPGHADESPLLAVAHKLPTNRRDELGTLAMAFGDMGRALDQNIRALMETTTIKERMQGELNAARDIQLGILPLASAPAHADCVVGALLEPAKEVGGDLYDFFLLPDGRQAFVIGDVSDKGVPAALFMSMTVTLVRYALSAGCAPADAMTRINDRLGENNPGCMFVTLFIGIFDPQTGIMEYANGGHCQPMLIARADDSSVRLIEGISGPVVGVMPGMPYSGHQIPLSADDVCLLYSDGVSEAMNEAQELYGEERIERILSSHRNALPQEIVSALHADLVGYRGAAPQSDDITILCFARRSSV